MLRDNADARRCSYFEFGWPVVPFGVHYFVTLENLLDIRYAGYCSVAHKAANRDLQQNFGVFLFRNTINRKYPKNLLKRKMFKCREDHNS